MSTWTIDEPEGSNNRTPPMTWVCDLRCDNRVSGVVYAPTRDECLSRARLFCAAEAMREALVHAQRVILQAESAPYSEETLTEIRAALDAAGGGK